jgi:hypothetical protein
MAVMVFAARVAAQNIGPQRLELTLEAERLHFVYHFDNPSSFDTAALVPHSFEQEYRVDTLWLLGEAHYMAGVPWHTIGGVTPPRDGTADDHDTFFNPDGSIVVSGTTGGARMRAFRVSQDAQVARAGAVAIAVGYRFRLDRADFGVGHKTVTRNGLVTEAFDVTTREMTSSQLHEFLISASTTRRVVGRWVLLLDGDASPMTVARLTVQLPDKYPGQDLVFVARALAANARIRAVRLGAIPLEIVLDAGEIWSYSSESSIALGRIAFGVSFGLR